MSIETIAAAIEKLQNERNITAADPKAKAVAPHVAEALISFCRQSDAFAAAVTAGGSFEECCKKIMEKSGQAISDLEVYRRAVRHYLPGADVQFEMRIVTTAAQPEREDNIISLSLADFM